MRYFYKTEHLENSHLSSEHLEIPEVLLCMYTHHIGICLPLCCAERLVIFLDLCFRWVIHRFTITGKQKLSLAPPFHYTSSAPSVSSYPLPYVSLSESLSLGTFSISLCFVIYTRFPPHEVPQVFS